MQAFSKFMYCMLLLAPVRAGAEPVTNWMELTAHAVRTAGSTNPLYRTPANSRIEAQVGLAMFEAANAVDRRYNSYLGLAPDPAASSPAAVGSAAHSVLTRLLPDQSKTFDDALAVALAQVPNGVAEDRGVAIGKAAAEAAIKRAAYPGTPVIEPYRPAARPGEYIHPSLLSIRDFDVPMPPFFMTSADAYRPNGPQLLTSERYARDLAEVQSLGSKPSTTRRADKTILAKMILSIDYNPILAQVFNMPGRSLVENARTYALVQMASEDAWIAAIDAKVHFGNWRPITAIRNADRDGNDGTVRDPDWEPLLITPAHPDYVCAHCVNAAAIATVLEAETGSAPVSGIRITAANSPGIEYVARDWKEFVNEVSMSRIYAGAHTRFANEDGEKMGRQVAKLEGAC